MSDNLKEAKARLAEFVRQARRVTSSDPTHFYSVYTDLNSREAVLSLDDIDILLSAPEPGGVSFEMQYTDWSIDPYYVRYWDKAKPMTVAAENKNAAVNKALTILGDPPRGRTWAIRVTAIKDGAL